MKELWDLIANGLYEVEYWKKVEPGKDGDSIFWMFVLPWFRNRRTGQSQCFYRSQAIEVANEAQSKAPPGVFTRVVRVL